MRLLLLVIIFLKTTIGFSQVRSLLLNKETKESVPYASIYIKNHQKGTSSNSDGIFKIEEENNDTLIISSVGYKSKELLVSSVVDTIFLKPDIAVLEEVEVENKKRLPFFPKRNTIGEVSRSFFNSHWMASAGYPYEIARFFEFDDRLSETRFIKSIKVETSSEIKEAIFAVKFYKLGSDGLPGKILNKNTIIGKAKKGRHITKIDLGDEIIYFPKEGIFVAIEFLIIDENKRESDHPYTHAGNTYKYKFDPSFSVTDLEENNYYSLDIKNQKWTKSNVNKKTLKCEIILTE